MIITKLQNQIRKPGKISVYIDEKFVFTLSQEDIQFFGMKENCEISEEKYSFILEKLIYIKAQDQALSYLSYKKRTAFEVKEKLKDLMVSEEVIEKILSFLEKYHYIDDLDYCISYIRECKKIRPRSVFVIKMELKKRGVTDEILEKALMKEVVDEESDCLKLAEKKAKGKMDWNQKEIQKIYAFLLRKGYSYGLIRDVLKKLTNLS